MGTAQHVAVVILRSSIETAIWADRDNIVILEKTSLQSQQLELQDRVICDNKVDLESITTTVTNWKHGTTCINAYYAY